jgi:hypothetical protein
MRLTSFHSQFRSIGVNYNQIVKLLYKNFSEKKAAAPVQTGKTDG